MAERRKVIKTSTPAEIRRTLGRISNMVLNDELDPKAANSIITACNAILAGIRGTTSNGSLTSWKGLCGIPGCRRKGYSYDRKRAGRAGQASADICRTKIETRFLEF